MITLFLGGPADGELINVPVNFDYYQFLEPPTTEVLLDKTAEYNLSGMTTGYRRVDVIIKGQRRDRRSIFVPEDYTQDEIDRRVNIYFN